MFIITEDIKEMILDRPPDELRSQRMTDADWIEHWKQMYENEKKTREHTEALLRNTMAFMDRMKDQIGGYQSRINDLEGKIDFLRKSAIKIDIDKFEKTTDFN